MLKLLILLFIIILIITLIIILIIKNINIKCLTVNDQHIRLLSLMKTLDKVLNENNIPYYIEGGTLLGAVRDKKIIPWDDDIDIFIEEKYEKKLLSIDFSNYNLDLNSYHPWPIKKSIIPSFFHLFLKKKLRYIGWYGYKITRVNSPFPFIDIFIRKNNNNKICIQGNSFQNEYFYKNEIGKGKKYLLNNILVNGAEYPYKYLERVYGKNWRIPKKTHTHADSVKDLLCYLNSKKKSKFKKKLIL